MMSPRGPVSSESGSSIDDFPFLFDDCVHRHCEGRPLKPTDAFVETIAAS
jgi:hypothetical protein